MIRQIFLRIIKTLNQKIEYEIPKTSFIHLMEKMLQTVGTFKKSKRVDSFKQKRWY
jgi:ribonuclease HIII